MIAGALLLLAALQIAGRATGRQSWSRRLIPEGRDASPHPVWAARLWLAFALPALAALLLLGRVEALWAIPPELADAARLARTWGVFRPQPVLIGLLLGAALGTLLGHWRVRRGKRPFHLGRPPRLPRSRAELPGAALLAISAGMAEELYFRLALPLLVAIVTGSGIAGVAAGAAAFGALHRYQGWVGMIATTLVGLFLSGLHLTSGALWLAMAAHAVIDLNALVVRPWLMMRSPSRVLRFPSPRTCSGVHGSAHSQGDAAGVHEVGGRADR